MRFGAHMSTAGGPATALQRGRSIGCEAIQIFVKNNMQWAARGYTPAEVGLFEREIAACDFACVFGHTGYLINVAGPEGPNRDKSLQSLAEELTLAGQLKLPFMVLHPGAHLGAGEARGLAMAIRGLDEVFRSTKRVKIALEVTAGQGSCLGSRLEHLACIIDHSGHPERLGICLDTAHLFAAGYPVHTRMGWDNTIAAVEELIGLERVLAFHLNDSQAALGSSKDRHAHIGKGGIGLAGFRHIVRDARFRNHPACLETEKSKDMHEDVENLAVLRGLAENRKRRG